MAALSILIAVLVVAAALGHWTPILVVCVILSLAPQLKALGDEPHTLACLEHLRQRWALLWRRWIELLSDEAKFLKLTLLEFQLDEDHRKVSITTTGDLLWVNRDIGPTDSLRDDFRAHEIHHFGRLHHRPLDKPATQHLSLKISLFNHLCSQARHERQGAYTSPPDTKLVSPAYEFPCRQLFGRRTLPTRISVHDLAITACRLGMEWTIFRPEEGIMSATGNNRVPCSTFEPSLEHSCITQPLTEFSLMSYYHPPSLKQPTSPFPLFR